MEKKENGLSSMLMWPFRKEKPQQTSHVKESSQKVEVKTTVNNHIKTQLGTNTTLLTGNKRGVSLPEKTALQQSKQPLHQEEILDEGDFLPSNTGTLKKDLNESMTSRNLTHNEKYRSTLLLDFTDNKPMDRASNIFSDAKE